MGHLLEHLERDVDACALAAIGERLDLGGEYLGSAGVTTDAGGDVTFSAVLPLRTVAAGVGVTATATSPGGSTSEFSLCASAAACDIDEEKNHERSPICVEWLRNCQSSIPTFASFAAPPSASLGAASGAGPPSSLSSS